MVLGPAPELITAGALFVGAWSGAPKKVRRPAFDHTRLAAALATSADTLVVADSLPFQTLEGWGETYGGPLTTQQYREASNVTLAARLQAKLLLTHGELDYNRLPHQTLQVVDALVKANKDFDLLIVPNAGHAPSAFRGYTKRRAWDFLVRNLLGVSPPDAFDMFAAPAAQ